VHYLSVTQAKRHWLVIALRPQRGSCAFVYTRIPCGTQCENIFHYDRKMLAVYGTAVKIHTVPLRVWNERMQYLHSHSASGQPALNSYIYAARSPASSLDFFLSFSPAARRDRERTSHMTKTNEGIIPSQNVQYHSVCLVQISKWSHKWAKYACFCVYLLWPDDASLDAWARWRTTQGWLRLLFAAWFIYS